MVEIREDMGAGQSHSDVPIFAKEYRVSIHVGIYTCLRVPVSLNTVPWYDPGSWLSSTEMSCNVVSRGILSGGQ